MAHVASLRCVVVGDPTTPLVVAGSALRRTGLFLTTGPRGASLRDRSGLSCALPRDRNGKLRLSAQVCLSRSGMEASGHLVRDAKGPMRAIGSGSFDVVLY